MRKKWHGFARLKPNKNEGGGFWKGKQGRGEGTATNRVCM
jgi:hypothetical protein